MTEWRVDDGEYIHTRTCAWSPRAAIRLAAA